MIICSHVASSPRLAPGRWRSILAIWLLFGALASTPAVATDEARPFAQRQAYRQAVDHLLAGRTSAASRIAEDLSGYVLAPYLTYHRNRLRLGRLSADEVQGFRNAHPDLPGAHRIYWQWLRGLASQGRWSAFVAQYEETDDAEFQCLYLRALYATGRRTQALDMAPALWISPVSQPKACDPIFQIWQQARLTDEMAWERLRLAIAANERTLANYLTRFFSSRLRPWAQAWRQVHVNPSRIQQTSRYSTDSTRTREVIGHGLKRLAARDAEAALATWQQYQASHEFSESEATGIRDAIDIELARSGQLRRWPQAGEAPETAERFAETYLEQADWPLISAWIEHMHVDARFSEKWQYWSARALEATHTRPHEPARKGYQSLAEKRSYYGFLAAQRLGQPMAMNDASGPPDDQARASALEIGGVARALELFAVRDEVNARRELDSILPRLTETESQACVTMVQEAGYPALAIRNANRAGLKNYLDLRFPVLYRRHFAQASHQTDLPLSLLLAFARQESAFVAHARSSANARGLLQILPSTARATARRAGLPQPSASDLYRPEINVPLGAAHIARLLQRYDQSLPLAAAAYNAGESRVRRWRRDRGGVPLDVWIERIPFSETRNYVKNLLAFNQVYAYRLGRPTPLLPNVDELVTPGA